MEMEADDVQNKCNSKFGILKGSLQVDFSPQKRGGNQVVRIG